MMPEAILAARTPEPTAPARPESSLLTRLGGISRGQSLGSLAERLEELARFVESDMARIERDLTALSTAGSRDDRVVVRGAHHLVALGGKRLRPTCVVLAARAGAADEAIVRDLAIAVELTHCATLLHDDVVDVGDLRRGAPSTRAIWGNAVSIFAGDWLLVDALRRVGRTKVDGLLERLLDVIDEMILAESLQLERRGDFSLGLDTWWRVAEGKTAALFRWAMLAGAKAGGLDEASCRALEAFGMHVGVAFQAVDDVLDLAGNAETTGKALFADLREGKVTYPVMVATERDPALLPLLSEAARPDAEPPPSLYAEIKDRVERSGALAAGKDLANARAEEAIASLDVLPDGRAKAALETVARAIVTRRA